MFGKMFEFLCFVQNLPKLPFASIEQIRVNWNPDEER
jgi:hypothetical protein